MYYEVSKIFVLQVKRAEDFYVSLGLPLMTKRFWKYSYFGENNGNTKQECNNDDIKCHGTAANMYQNEDYRQTIYFSF